MRSNQTISQQVAEYVTKMTVGDLPPEVIAKTKLCILDAIGCMVAGSQDRVSTIVAKHIKRQGANGTCTLFGHPGCVGPEAAALANGIAAHVLELDDGHRPSDNHLGCVVVPAALAMAQATEAPAAEFLLSASLGYDVMGRVGEAVLLPRQRLPFHGTATTGVFGSAAAAGRLLGLTSAQLVNALGVAGDGASGLGEYRGIGADCKPLHAGRAAQAGITAALLAAEGYQGPPRIFEGQHGFCNAFAGEPRPELICAELGQRFAVLESGFKVHASTGGTFTAIDAALWLRKEYRLQPHSIRRIKIALPRWARERPGAAEKFRHPKSVGESRQSILFVVAAAFHDGEVTHCQHTSAKLVDPGIAALEERIEFTTDREVEEIFNATRLDAQFFVPCALEVDCGERVYRRLERTPRGYNPDRSLSQAEVVGKFRSLAKGVLSEPQTDRLIDWALGLDSGSQMRDLLVVLSGSMSG